MKTTVGALIGLMIVGSCSVNSNKRPRVDVVSVNSEYDAFSDWALANASTPAAADANTTSGEHDSCTENESESVEIFIESAHEYIDVSVDGVRFGVIAAGSSIMVSLGAHQFDFRQEICYPRRLEVCVDTAGQRIFAELEKIPELNVRVLSRPSGIEVCFSTDQCQEYTPIEKTIWAGNYDVFAIYNGEIRSKTLEINGRDGDEIELFIDFDDMQTFSH
ncbi:MAG: hypothetical protein ACOZBH_02400 [Patescibacteria group bacterium]